ncbi:DNA polymerase delta subunit 4 [Hibiscus syriacus]|uniref:DNA polymerase delta subunit 4 n=1 Tax=Hibiscus syriacus TaxID=106335 RepID=A0A6A3CYW5_HIBSY|nr:uncharacterized protein LOC120123442 isoform X2 [Hibiscus syriacus]KAE8733687.1 DNA polymerase delta subunit 4 [Hibiscus syriacus]
MATPPKNIEGFYKQKKSNTSKSKSSNSTKHAAATSGSNIAQPPALVSHGGSLDLEDDFDEEQQVLRQFDMNMEFGPCIGIPRIDRWERARRLGLNPPKEIESILKRGKVKRQSLFGGRT